MSRDPLYVEPELPSVKTFIKVEGVIIAVFGLLVLLIVLFFKLLVWIVKSIYHLFVKPEEVPIDTVNVYWEISSSSASPFPAYRYKSWPEVVAAYMALPGWAKGADNKIYRFWNDGDFQKRQEVDPTGDGFFPRYYLR